MKLYSRISDHETILEIWGGSTKHPDTVFNFKDFKMPDCWRDKSDIDQSSPVFIYQWLIQCASEMLWPFHTKRLVDFANDWYEVCIG